MSKENNKYCVDCKFNRNGWCISPKRSNHIDFESGARVYDDNYCQTHRDSLKSGYLMCRLFNLCGREGRFFEPAEKPLPQPPTDRMAHEYKIMDKTEYQVGFNSHRLKREDLYHKKECDFVDAINTELKYNNNILAQIVGKEYLDENETKIVLSVIQWLGTPVGQGFLDRVSKMWNCG